MTTEIGARPTRERHIETDRRRPMPEWVDRLLGSDPGLNRMRTALQAVLTIGVAMLAERIFVDLTHALQIDTHGAVLPPAQAALVAAQHHGVMVIAIIVGALIGMMASVSGGMFASAHKQLEAFLLMPPLMVAGLALGLALAPLRVPSLVALVVILALGAYCRRFGPLGFLGGQMVFLGDFFGFFLHSTLGLSDIGWLTAEICIGSAVAIVTQFTVFYPGRRSALRRTQRSYDARARAVAAAALDLLEEPEDRERAARRLHRRLVRLNETALMIDAQLSDPGSLPPRWSAAAVHQILFDTELALTNMARFAEKIADLHLTAGIHTQVRAALVAVGHQDFIRADLAGHELLAELRRLSADGAQPVPGWDCAAHVVVHRFAISVLGFVEAADNWRREAAAAATRDAPTDDLQSSGYQSPVTLIGGGWLPGSALVSAAASKEAGPESAGHPWHGRRPWDRVALVPDVRVAIQMGVAVAGAIALGDVLSGKRFYWAVIAAFITFMGANTTGEQIRKGLLRVAGTVVGALVGATLAHMVGQRTDLAVAVILIALFFGLYLLRISYAFMVVGITVMVSQLYVQLGEYTDHLLVLRLEETALGAGVAALTVIFVLPLRTGRVVRVAARDYLQTLAAVVEQSLQSLLQPDMHAGIRNAIRGLDNAYHSLDTTMISLPVLLHPRGTDSNEQFLQAATATRHYARNLLIDTGTMTTQSAQMHAEVTAAQDQFAASMAELTSGLQNSHTTNKGRTYVRTAALFDLVATRVDGDFASPQQLALRDLQLIDGALATMAGTLGLTVKALDTTDSLTDPAPSFLGLCGVIRSEAGGPVEDVGLTLLDAAGQQVAHGRGAADGHYELAAPAPGSYLLIVQAGTYQPQAATVQISGRTEHSVTLLGAGAVGGRVSAPDGPAAGVTVTITDARGEVVAARITGADGAYGASGLLAGTYTVVASGAALTPVAGTVQVPAAGTERHDIEVCTSGRLSGLVHNRTGAPVADAVVRIADGAGRVLAAERTDPAGRYQFAELPAGSYTVIASSYPPAIVPMQLVDDQRRVQDVTLQHDCCTDGFGEP